MISKVLAVFLAYIAYQQWQTTERQRRQDLFEMRYENIHNILFDQLDQDVKDAKDIRDGVFDREKFEKKYKKTKENLTKYQYFIKKNDNNKIMAIYEDLYQLNYKFYKNQNNNDTEEINLKNYLIQFKEKRDLLYKILEPYLRIEPERTIWDIIKNFIIGTYEFLTPKWFQNLLSKIKTVILNSFQNLTKKWQKPTSEAE